MLTGAKSLIREASQSFDVERASVIQDEVGGKERQWVPSYSDQAGWMQPRTSKTEITFGTRGFDYSHVLYSVDVLELIEGDRITYSGRSFLCTGFLVPCELDEYQIIFLKEQK